ncbi:MAG: hypothetical protein QNJ31_04390 [Candidatus Caenarcaniphilales bacterium]|nr:hypothetical protein [Candidatus Caenarcaniphilales bacterium]
MLSFDPKLPFIDLFSHWTKSGLEKATLAMESLMSQQMEFSEPFVLLTDIDNLTKFFAEDRGDPSVCLLQNVSGSLDGFFLFAAPMEVINEFTQTISRQVPGKDLSVTEFDLAQSIMNEWANIFAGNVISSIQSPKIGIIELTSTEQTYDMSGAALDFIACQMGVDTNQIAICHSCIHTKNSKKVMNVWIVINPDSHLFKLKDIEPTLYKET